VKPFSEAWGAISQGSFTDHPKYTSNMTIANEKTSARLFGTLRPCKISGAVHRAVPPDVEPVSSTAP